MAESPPAVSPLLRLLDPAAEDELAAIAQPVTFASGALMLKQGAATRGAYFLRSGTAEAAVRLPGGDTLVVAQLGPGSVIGEMSLLEHGQCSATVIARAPIDGVFVGREDFRVLVARRSPAALKVQEAITLNLCAKLTTLNARVLACPAPEDLPFSPVPTAIDPLAGNERTRDAAFAWRSFLPVLPMFRGADPEEIAEIADAARVIELPRGEAIFYEGQSADACFITVRGAVEVSAPAAGKLRRLAVLGPGQMLGYRSMLDGTPHSARALAREATLVMELPRDIFLALYHGGTPGGHRLQAAVHAALLQSMAGTNVQLTRLINLARVRETAGLPAASELEAALQEQVVYAS
jgi:CRP-like cAMP-binding protein